MKSLLTTVLAPIAALVIATVIIASSVQAPNVNNRDPLWEATAYCKGHTVAVGLPVKRGMAASDPRVIPLGSIVRVSHTGSERWNGVYMIVDTGPEIKGREIDLYSWSCYEALEFGRRMVKVEIVRHGWMPNGLVER